MRMWIWYRGSIMARMSEKKATKIIGFRIIPNMEE